MPLGAFAEEYGLIFGLVSDTSGDAIAAYGLPLDLPDLGLHGVPNRAVYVLEERGTVTCSWVVDSPVSRLVAGSRQISRRTNHAWLTRKRSAVIPTSTAAPAMSYVPSSRTSFGLKYRIGASAPRSS